MGDPRIDAALAAGDVPRRISVAILEMNRDLSATVSIVIVTALATLIVLCRLLSRRFIIKRFGLGLDDGIALASLVVFIPFAALCLELIQIGGGRTFPFIEFVLDEATAKRIQVIDSIAHLVYSTALLLCRVSGLAFYYRICALHKEFLIAIRVIFAVLIVGYLVQMLLVIFHCKPVNMAWLPTSNDDELWNATCLQWYQVYSTISGISLACDFLLFGLPVAMLKILDMPRKQMVQLACILLPGLVVVGISCGRVALVVFYGNEEPRTFKFAFLRLLIVEVSEVSATLIALSIPGVKPMVDKFILRKDNCSEFGGSRISSNRGSIGSQSSGLSTLKGLSHFNVLGDESAAQYGAAVCLGEQKQDRKQEGIQVTVDVYVEDGRSKPTKGRQNFI
ncbi:hypothetical protein HRG_001087 [Hirsutella rhossiliensis]|uniref:Proteinrelated to integral membrane protein pth11 n=1 Tax=Hirsutella rhossiliensis TaxID=111463 RepID=A0A9P8N7L2_9HYPO|nr:proteinrelated to integral membrane protein pth11 [Hirsutella rhossiliensis]KAH0968445.1 proteinrelated to integral membrane protein pth11 [Hirsutella rhossiliensis]